MLKPHLNLALIVLLKYATRSLSFFLWPPASLFYHLLRCDTKNMKWTGCQSDTCAVAFTAISVGVFWLCHSTLPGTEHTKNVYGFRDRKRERQKERFLKAVVTPANNRVFSTPGSYLEVPSRLTPNLQYWGWTLSPHGYGTLRNS